MRLKSFDESLLLELQDKEFAAAYLADALNESTEEFLIALRKYIETNGGTFRANVIT
jgi:DNA-binding phage protein